MNEAQQYAAMRLQSALAECRKVGLAGGVFDASFCVWPSANGSPFEHGDFFEGIQSLGGEVLNGHGMWLDGGAGN